MGYKIIQNGQILTISDGTVPQYYVVNTEADKPPNPSPGDIVKVLATTKEYTCFVTNLWSLTNSPCKETYSNHIGTNDAVANSYTNGTAQSGSGAPHVHVLSSGDGIQHYGSWMFEIYANPTTQYFIFSAKLGPIVNGNEANRGTAIGMSDSYVWVDGPKNRTGCYFCHGMDDTWSVITYDGSSGALETVIANLADGDDLVILGQINRILYFVNGVLVANHNQYLPSITLFPVAICSVDSAAGTIERQQKIDFMGIEVMK